MSKIKPELKQKFTVDPMPSTYETQYESIDTEKNYGEISGN